jgi:hypothetical protein
MSYPNEIAPYNSTSNPTVKLAQYNTLLSRLEFSASIIVRPNGSYYEAIKGGTNAGSATVLFGSQYNVGPVNGAVLLDVANAAIASLTEGLILFKDLDIPAVTAKDGVILRSFKAGVEQTEITNPTSEVATVTNTQNVRMIHYLAKPTNDPPTLDAWSTISAEIDIGATLTKYGVAGYFGAIARAGCAGYIWGLNPLVWLEAGCTGNAIGIEVDVNNYAVADKGEGVTVACNNGNNPYSAFKCNSAGSARWNRAMLLEKWHDNGIILVDDQTGSHQALAIQYPTSCSGVPFNITYNNLNCYSLTQSAGAVTLLSRNHTGAPVDLMAFYTGTDTQALFRVSSTGTLYWGVGGASVEDVNLYHDIANGLKTDDQLYAADGLIPLVKAGTISDADLTNTSKAGVLGVDITNNRIYFRTNTATWKYCQADGGFVIPAPTEQEPNDERICGDCGKPIEIGQKVCGRIEKSMSDGTLHGLWVHLSCPE